VNDAAGEGVSLLQSFGDVVIRSPMYIRSARAFPRGLVVLSFLLAVAGCASSQQEGWEGPKALSTSSVDAWQYKGDPGFKLGTPHYTIYTTIKKEDVRMMLPQLLEGGFAQYRLLVPGIALSDKPMECFIFGSREEFNDFTRENTGKDALIYIQIRRGGYALKDRFVSYQGAASAIFGRGDLDDV
jgi:hypothetical protein